MNYKKLLFLILLIKQTIAPLQAQSFVYSSISPEDEIINTVIEDEEGNFLCVNFIGSRHPDVQDGLIIKLDKNGQELKRVRIIAENTISAFSGLVATSDKHYLGIGYSRPIGKSFDNIWVVEFNEDLDIIWEKRMGSDLFNERPENARLSADGNILITGGAFNLSYSNMDAFFYKISSEGDSLFSIYLDHPSTPFQAGYDVLDVPSLQQHWFFTGGLSEHSIFYTSEFVKMDYSGTITDTIFFSEGEDIFFKGIITAKWLSDTTFIISGRGHTVYSGWPPKDDEYDLRVSVRGMNDSVIWIRNYGKKDTVEMEAPNSGLDFIDPNEIYIGGTSNFHIGGGFFSSTHISEYILYKMDSQGEIIWENCYGNNTYLTLAHVLATSDGGCLLTGFSYDHSKATEQERDIFIVKVDKEGNLVTGVQELKEEKLNVTVYPNPFSESFNVELKVDFPATIEVYDLKGSRYHSGTTSEENTRISTSGWPQQIYFYRIINDQGQIITGKLSKVR